MNVKKKNNKDKNEESAYNSSPTFPQDTIINADINKFDSNIKKNNIVSTILRTNSVRNDIYGEQEEEKTDNLQKLNIEKNSMYENYKEKGKFKYIITSEKVKPFLYKVRNNKEYSSHAFNNFNFLDMANSYKMIINILIDDDSLQSIINLKNIFDLIESSLKYLNDINITYKDFLICIYYQHFSNEEAFKDIFPHLEFFNCNNWNLKMNTFYCSYGNVILKDDIPFSILNFYKESASYAEVYKFFFCNILNDLISLINADPKEKNKTFLVVNWPNGKKYDESCNTTHKEKILSEIFRISNNRNMILIPDINYYPYNGNDYSGYLNKYNLDSDKIYVNLLWDMMCAYPIDHRFFFVNMNYNLYLIFKEYYQNNKISIYSNEYYNDYNLSIYVRQRDKTVVIQKIQTVTIEYRGLPLNLADIFYDFTLRRGSEFANSFKLFPFFFNFRNMSFSKFLQKFVILFKLFCVLVEFFWLGLSLVISYAIFNETFGKENYNTDYFCSLGYAIMVILLLFISLIYIKNKPKIKRNIINRNTKRNEESYCIILILYIIHYIYNIFLLICSIIAIIKVYNGTSDFSDNYHYFRKNYFILLLILNLIFAFIPSLIKITTLPTKGFLLYLLLQFPNSTCFFHIPYLITCIRNINSEKKKYESLYISLYLLLNGAFTIMCIVFDTKRQRRMDFFYLITIILAVLSGIKILILIFSCSLQNIFNRHITTGQIPQYHIVTSEDDKNIINYNYTNNKDKMIKNINIKEKNINSYDKRDNKHSKILKKGGGLEREYSSQVDIRDKKGNSLLNEKVIKQSISNTHISKKISKKNVSKNDLNDN